MYRSFNVAPIYSSRNLHPYNTCVFAEPRPETIHKTFFKVKTIKTKTICKYILSRCDYHAISILKNSFVYGSAIVLR